MNYLPHIKKSIHSSIVSSKIVDNLNNFRSIFSYNKKKDASILLLKKIEFDIFYSCKVKYPLLVMETLTNLTGKTDPSLPFIDRRFIDDPFRQDIEIPDKSYISLDEYLKYIEYGGSMGHNASAGQHKTNLNIYYETFLLSNITPQDMVLNCGLWVLFEAWCKNLGYNNKLTNVKIFTGSIPDDNTTEYNNTKINVPTKMFKIVCFQLINNPTITYCDILMTNNSSYYITYKNNFYDLNKFFVTNKEWFQKTSNINIKVLLDYYGYNSENIKSFKNIIPTHLKLSLPLQKLIKKSMWYGYIIYSPNIETLEQVWEQCIKLNKIEFENLEFHQIYYETTKKRLLRDNLHYINDTFKKNVALFTKLYNNEIEMVNQKKNSNNAKNSNSQTIKKHSKSHYKKHIYSFKKNSKHSKNTRHKKHISKQATREY